MRNGVNLNWVGAGVCETVRRTKTSARAIKMFNKYNYFLVTVSDGVLKPRFLFAGLLRRLISFDSMWTKTGSQIQSTVAPIK